MSILTKVKNREKNPVENWPFRSPFFSDLADWSEFPIDRSTRPLVNIKEGDAHFSVELAAPGLKKEDFKLEIEDDLLTVSCEDTKETEDKNENFTRKEFQYSSFSRSFQLPPNVNQSEIKANYKDGLLSVHIPKKQSNNNAKTSIEVD